MVDLAVGYERESDYNNNSPLVMVVDDEANMCAALKRILESQGFSVAIAMDGKTALRLVHKLDPDVVLLDIMMPGMDGRELCARVREISDCHIIYLSGRVDLAKSQNKLAENERADAFITKPATAKHIVSVIEATLAVSR